MSPATGRLVDTAGAVAFAVLGFAVLLAPAVAVQWDLVKEGVGSLDDDLLLASLVAGAVHAVLSGRRWRAERDVPGHRSALWLSSLDALVLLALGGSALLLGLLFVLPDERLTLGNVGSPAVTAWLVAQLAAVALAEVVARRMCRWLASPPTEASTPAPS